MDPALDPLTVPVHVEAPAQPGEASLAMAMAALEPERDARALFEELEEPGVPDPGRLALEALQRGFHAVLRGPVAEPDRLETARQAGLLHHRQAAGVRDVVQALEAGHPALALVERSQLREKAPAGPHWICLVGQDGDEAAYHDPIDEDGPDAIAWEALSPVIGHGSQRLLLEIGPANRVDR